MEYELNRLNFAKRVCSDEANLCEIVEINAGKNVRQFETVKEIFKNNNFDVMYREQLERMTADGTTGAYIRLDNATLYEDGSVKGGDININYVDARGIIPLTIINKEITECAFSGSSIRDTKTITTLVIFRKVKGIYYCSTYEWEENGKEIYSLENVRLGEVKPFSIMRNAEVNNLDKMEGFGLPKLWNTIPFLKALDLCYNLLFSDLDKGEKLILVNELLCEFGEDGKPILTPEQKKLFVLLGEALPNDKEIYHEFNPEIRIEAIVKAFEACLSLISLQFGFGTRKYTFEDGRITTATEYAGIKQDQLQELNKQRQQSIKYITELAKAVMWYSNTFKSTKFDLNTEITVEFNDSYINDEQAELEDMRNDAIQFGIPKLTIWYLMRKYSLSEDEAAALLEESNKDEESDEDSEE